jgi:hypothetical protein
MCFLLYLSLSITSLVQAATQTVIPSLLLYHYMMMLATCCQQDYMMTCQEAPSQFWILRTGMQTYPTLLILMEHGHLMGNKVSITHLLSHQQVMLLLPAILLRKTSMRGLFLIAIILIQRLCFQHPPPMPPLGLMVQQTASLQSNLPTTKEVTPTEQTGLESGKAFLVPSKFDKGRYCFTNNDRAMMRLYSLCDQAGSPRYLLDQVLAELKVEISRNQFDPSHTSITKREAFMARMHRKFPSPPPEPIQVQLESFSEPVTVYWFSAIQQLQQHLLRCDVYGDVKKMNVNPQHQWDQSFLPPSSHMREVTDGSWHKQVIYIKEETVHPPSDLNLSAGSTVEDPHQPFLITLEQYQDSTGTYDKESFSLEPVVLTTGLLKAKFNSDHRSRFIIGYIPSFSNKKSSADQTRQAGTKSGFGSSVRDYHKCLSILLEPILVKAQTEHPLLDVLLGDQIKHVRAILVMGAFLADGKSNEMLCGRVAPFSGTLCLSQATFTQSEVASDARHLFHWIKTRVIEKILLPCKLFLCPLQVSPQCNPELITM